MKRIKEWGFADTFCLYFAIAWLLIFGFAFAISIIGDVINSHH